MERERHQAPLVCYRQQVIAVLVFPEPRCCSNQLVRGPSMSVSVTPIPLTPQSLAGI